MIYDISVPLSDKTPVYEGDPDIEITPASRIANGDSANVSILKFGSHTGTHIDPQYHFIDGGTTVDRIPLDMLVGECFVCPVEGPEVIEVQHLESAGIPDNTVRILFKTRNSEFWSDTKFHKDYTYLHPDAASWLLERGVKLIGIDYLSIEQFHSGHHATHLSLLRSETVIIEGLDLREISGGIYTLVCLPLRIQGGDGSPSRAILIR
ncbi:MAG: cyclase family protein [Armatimonadota bacterium]